MNLTSRPRLRTHWRRKSASDRQTQEYCGFIMAVGAANDATAAAQAAADGLRSLLAADRSALVLFDRQAGPLVTANPTASEAAPPFGSVHTPQLERLLQDRKSLILSQTHEESSLAQPDQTELPTIQALIAVPIIVQQAIVAVVSVEQFQPRAWQPNEILLVEAIAGQLAQHLERVRLGEALERRTEELTAVGHTAVTISSQLDLPVTLHTILEQAARLTRSDAGLLYLCDEARGELEVVVSYRLDQNYCGQRIKLGEGLAGRAALSRQIESVPDYGRWEGRIQRWSKGPLHAVIAVPLLHDEHVLGVIDLVHYRPSGAFNEIDQAVVKLFAVQAVVAITNARLFDQAQHYADRMAALARASQLLDAQGDMAASIQPLVQEGMSVLGAQACLVILSRPGQSHEMYYKGISEREAALLRQYIAPECACRTGSSEVRTVYDIRDIIPADVLDRVVLDAGFSSTISLPLIREERPIGCVSYFYSFQHIWNQDEIELARVVANQIAAMITNVQLYHEVHEANRLKADFVSTVSHELRTPMGAIIGYTEMLLNGLYGDLPASLFEPLMRVKTNADQLLTLINQMLDLSRIDAHRLELLQEPYNLHDLIQSVTAIMQPLAFAKSLHFYANIDPAVPHILIGDVSRLRQILINLVGNSVKFTNQGKIEIRCSIRLDGDRPLLVFEVIDTGIGIPADQFVTIWEPFRQGNSSTTREYSGTGLGLAIVRKLTELMEGTAGVTSSVGGGSTFTITLPLLTPERDGSGI
ncbi:MAG TPA: GAF domain-containing sensor histidine kinase [Herpetosiphonaceae bacterium]